MVHKILALQNSFAFLDMNIHAISLSNGNDPSVGEFSTAIGWGSPSDSSEGISDVLREVNVPIMENNKCNDVYGIVSDGNICIDSTGGKGTCSV